MDLDRGSVSTTVTDRLRTIASLQFGIAKDRLDAEKAERLRIDLSGLPRGVPHVPKRREIELEYAEKMCAALATIWVHLFEETNNGVLTRKNVDFIKAEVQAVASARISSLMTALSMAPNQAAIAGHVAREKGRIEARVFRELELRFLRQEAGLSKVESMEKSISVNVENAANINFSTQVGTITAAVNVMSQQGQTEMLTPFEN